MGIRCEREPLGDTPVKVKVEEDREGSESSRWQCRSDSYEGGREG